MIVIALNLIRQRYLSAIKNFFYFYNNVNRVRSLLRHTYSTFHNLYTFTYLLFLYALNF